MIRTEMYWVLTAFAVLIGSPLPGTAQVCGELELYCVEQCASCHEFNEGDEDNEEFDGGGLHDGECYHCLKNGAEVEATECHPSCNPMEDEDQDEEQAAAYLDIIDAASARDVPRILRSAARAPGVVVLNHERQSLQIRGCGGAFIANLPLGDSFPGAVALAARLQENEVRGWEVYRGSLR